MKKILVLYFIAGVSFVANAQIPNAGFENWTSAGTYSNPDGWSTTNSGAATTAIKGSPGDPGSYYLKLVSQSFLGGVIPAIAASGKFNSSYQLESGFPYSSQPRALTGNWQYMAGLHDSGYIIIGFSKWNASKNKRDTVGFAYKNLNGMVMGWQSFSIPIQWFTSQDPDTGLILFSASNSNTSKAVAGSYLYIDNLAFEAKTGIESIENSVPGFSVYPNPASNLLNVSFKSGERRSWTIQLSDMSGRIVDEYKTGAVSGNFSHTLATNGLAKGLYMLKVCGEGNVSIKKVLITE